MQNHVTSLKTILAYHLELCGVLLVAKLTSKTEISSHITFVSEAYWTDSMIMLAWIKDYLNYWKIFIANHILQIQAALFLLHSGSRKSIIIIR